MDIILQILVIRRIILKYSVIINEDLDGGYFAQVPELKGCFTQAETLDELRKNIEEAIALTLEDEVYEQTSNFVGVWELEVNSNAAVASY